METEDLKCCGNCNEYHMKNNEYWWCTYLKKEKSPFNLCEEWEFDDYKKGQRIDETAP